MKLRLAETSEQSSRVERYSILLGEAMSRSGSICPIKLVALFDEKRDDLDAYWHRFERIAVGQGWKRSEGATVLSMCFVCEGLSVFGRMPADEWMDYDKVKVALQQRFRLTTEGFRKKFRASEPEDAQTAKHFVALLSNYFHRWIELARAAKPFQSLRELMIAE